MEKDKGLIIDQGLFIILICLLLFVPIALRLQTYTFFTLEPGLRLDAYTGIHYDLFTIYKMKILIALTITAGILFAFKIITTKDQIILRLEHYLVFAMVALYLISSRVSPFWFNTMFGFDDTHQGFVNIVCYMVLFLAASNIRLPSYTGRWYVAALSSVVILNFAVTYMSSIKILLINIPVFRVIFVPGQYSAAMSNVLDHIPSLFGNPDYSSGFMAAAFVMFGYLLAHEREWLKRAGYVALLVISGMGVYYSAALSGYFTAGISGLFLAFYLRKEERVSTFSVTILLVCLIIMGGILTNNIIYTRGKVLQAIGIEKPVDMGKMLPARYYHENFGFPVPYRSRGANRQGIWEETVKLILKKPLIGHGADTLYYYFPNKSLAAYEKITNVYNGEIITKPHNYFLSIAFDAGIPALLCFLGVLFLLYRRTWRLLVFNRFFAKPLIGVLALFCSGLLCQAIPNDLTIGTGTVMWISLGLWLGLLNGNDVRGADPVRVKS